MTEEEIYDNNKIIANFSLKEDIYNNPPLIDFEKKGIRLKYHSDWNDLMRIIDEIQSTYKYEVVIYNGCCDINMADEVQTDAYVHNIVSKDYKHGCSPIDNTYLAIIEFIKWNNDQKNKGTKR